MKKIISLVLASILVVAPTLSFAQDAEHPVKTVCHDRVGKDGKPAKDKKGNVLQDCKKVKIHKKFEGTKVPDKK